MCKTDILLPVYERQTCAKRTPCCLLVLVSAALNVPRITSGSLFSSATILARIAKVCVRVSFFCFLRFLFDFCHSSYRSLGGYIFPFFTLGHFSAVASTAGEHPNPSLVPLEAMVKVSACSDGASKQITALN
jgi:hypothetical protein